MDIEKLLLDYEFCEAFGDVLYNEIMTDDESAYMMARYVLRAYLAKDVDEMLIAVSGWNMETLIEKAMKVAEECRDKECELI